MKWNHREDERLNVQWHSTGLEEARMSSDRTQALIIDLGGTDITYNVDFGVHTLFKLRQFPFLPGILRITIMLLLLSHFSHVQFCDPIDGSPPGSPVPGILQARTLEWVAISFSNAWKGKGKVKSLSRVQLSATPWTAAHQAPLSMGFSRQEYWSGVPLLSWANV